MTASDIDETHTGGGSPFERELAREQAHVDQVYTRLEESARNARRVAAEGQALYRSDRGTVVREEDGTSLYERDVFAFQAAKRLATLDAEHEGLVFGRLDHTTGEVRHIGRIGVRDEEYEPLVIDWRAPAAEPFYRATPTDPMTVVRRRVLRCRGDRVIDLSDDLLDSEHAGDDLVVVGEGALMAALTRARGHTMKDIVATIQAEQDEAIRAPHAGFTLLTGGPGTGKTVVALHRAAYLLYSHRRKFENGGVLVVGPSRVFMNYIERVLPSLGEEAVTLRAIGAVAEDVLPVTGERLDHPQAAEAKGSRRMARLLRRLVDEPLTDATATLRVMVKGEALTLAPPRLARIRTAVLRQHKVNPGRPAAEAALLDALWERWTELVATHPTLGQDLDRHGFEALVTDTASWKMFGNAWWPVLSAPQLLARLSDPAVVARVGEGLFDDAEQAALTASYDPDTLAPHGTARWSVADIALLDELVHLIGPAPQREEDEVSLFLEDGGDVAEVVTTADRLSPQPEVDPDADPHDTYAHILVDEAQDLSPMQWRMLRRRGPAASWTIVGDPAQSSWPNDEAEAALDALIGTSPVRRFRLSTNYRSPAEVFNLAARVVTAAFPSADLPTAVRATGIEPDLALAEADWPADLAARVRELAGQVAGTIGVIAPESLLDEVRGAVAGIDAQDRVVVVTPLESKGLEYDAVVVVSPDRIVAEASLPGGDPALPHAEGVRVLYVALTRPTQRLVTIDLPDDAGRWRRSAESPATSSE